MKSFFIKTYGCQMNERDSERMAGFLLDQGFRPAASEAEADLILVNTCSIREKPEQKVYSTLGRYSLLKQERPGTILAVTGCVAQQEGGRLLERVPGLDLAIGTQALHRLPELLTRVSEGRRLSETGWLKPDDPGLFEIPSPRPQGGVTAFVTIMQGCDNYCAYCVVPYVRGRERSRPAEEVLAEVESLAAGGVKEVTLLGQNVNTYGPSNGAGIGFPELLRRVAEVPGLERVRFTTSHPKDLSDRLIEVMAEHPKVMEHIHLPVQAGSDRVLRAMNRGYTREHYLERVRALRRAMPEAGLTTDLIVGFPGEREADFKETLALMGEAEYDESYSFRFSPRPLTAAGRMEGQLPEETKLERLYRLQALQAEITERKHQAQVGSVHEVLVEGRSKTDAGRETGRSRTNRPVHVPAGDQERRGRIISVRVTRALKHSLVGEVLGEE